MDFPAVKKQVTIVHSAVEACKNKEAVVIATEWNEFREIDWQAVYTNMNKPAFVFDGRLLVDADKLRQIGFKVCPYINRSHDAVRNCVFLDFRSLPLVVAKDFDPTLGCFIHWLCIENNDIIRARVC